MVLLLLLFSLARAISRSSGIGTEAGGCKAVYARQYYDGLGNIDKKPEMGGGRVKSFIEGSEQKFWTVICLTREFYSPSPPFNGVIPSVFHSSLES